MGIQKNGGDCIMKVGDLVRHKNHPLTGIVLEIGDNGHVRCLWDDDEGDCWVIEWWVMPCK